ncbi:MAG: extracellular solute-binding protein [Clostridia bacterium]|nr:extracellular solute-binding protein [Clostridia bacterium]
MKIFTKKTGQLLSAILACAMITACGGPTTTTEDGKTIVEVSEWPTYESGIKLYDGYLASFNENYGDKYEIVQNTWIYDYQTFLMKAASGQLPTVLTSAFTEADRMKNSGYGADITDKLEELDLLDRMEPRAREIVEKDGRIYCAPKDGYLLGVVFNANLFEQAGLKNADGTYQFPKTWDELAETAKVIKEKTGKAGFLLGALDAGGGWLFTNVAWSFGVNFVEQNEDGKWIATFNSRECYDAFQYMYDLKWKHDVIPASYMLSQQQGLEFLATDQVAMLLDSPSTNARTCVTKYKMNIDGVGAFAMPEGPARRVALLGGRIIAASADSTEEQINGAFEWWKTTGELPAIELTEEYKAAKEASYQEALSAEIVRPIGVYSYSPWTGVESTAYDKEMVDKYRNVPVELYADYNASLTDETTEIQAEVPVCCQDLYTLLTGILQNIWSNEDADIEALVNEACEKWQKDYLDQQVNK